MGAVLLRTIIVYIAIVFALRIMGKRQLGELQPSELVVTILVSNIATLSIEDTNIPLLGSILPIFMLVSCEVLVSVLILKSSRVRKVISGNPVILIRDGRIDQKQMRSLRWSVEDLMEQLRINGVYDVAEVSFAIVETSGALSVFQKYRHRPVTPEALELPDQQAKNFPPMVLISDGEIIEDTLRYCNLPRQWLDGILKEQNLSPQDIFFMSCDPSAHYFLSVKETGGAK